MDPRKVLGQGRDAKVMLRSKNNQGRSMTVLNQLRAERDKRERERENVAHLPGAKVV